MAFHVYPLNDTKEHDLETSMCKCWPELKIENGELIIVHNSFDGREYRQLSPLEAYGCENRTIYRRG